jgi:hypothetical protein
MARYKALAARGRRYEGQLDEEVAAHNFSAAAEPSMAAGASLEPVR